MKTIALIALAILALAILALNCTKPGPVGASMPAEVCVLYGGNGVAVHVTDAGAVFTSTTP
jgi:hypothetical protein